MLDPEMICNMSKWKLWEYLLAHPDEAYEIHSMVDLRSKGFTISDIEELMGECPDFAEGIEDIIIDMDHKNFSEDYWEQLDDGYDPEAYFGNE